MARISYRSSLTAITIAIIFLFPAGALPAEDGGKLPFEPGDTLEEIRYKIDYNGYDFTVSENRISRMSREEKDKLPEEMLPLTNRRCGAWGHKWMYTATGMKVCTNHMCEVKRPYTPNEHVMKGRFA